MAPLGRAQAPVEERSRPGDRKNGDGKDGTYPQAPRRDEDDGHAATRSSTKTPGNARIRSSARIGAARRGGIRSSAKRKDPEQREEESVPATLRRYPLAVGIAAAALLAVLIGALVWWLE